MLPTKCINALLSIKANLEASTSTAEEGTSTTSQSVTVTLSDPPKMKKEPVSRVHMRHARSGGAFQTMCRRKDWASPVY